MQIHGRMVRREIQRAEVVPFGFRFGAGDSREAELAKDVFDLFDDERDGMLRAAPLMASGHRGVRRPRARAGARLCELLTSLLMGFA